MKQTFIFLFFCVLTHSVAGQVLIVPLPHQEGYFTLDDLWRVTLISTQSQGISALMEVRVEDGNHQLVLAATSTSFNLHQGSNRPSLFASAARMQYGIGKTTQVLRNTGRFPYGNYIICYRVITKSNEALIGELCQEETAMPFSPPELVSPFDRDSIETTMPILSWKPPFPQGDIPIEYSIKLVQIKDKQDVLEAIEKNAPLLSRHKIYDLHLIYPTESPKLEVGKSYAWQILATAGEYYLGATEVWAFSIKSGGPNLSRSIPDLVYRPLKLAPDGSFNPINQKLAFTFNNRFGAVFLEYENTTPTTNLDRVYYKIYPAGKQDNPINTTKTTVLLKGINRLSVDLQGVSGMNSNENYIMAIKEPTGREYFLEFTYLN